MISNLTTVDKTFSHHFAMVNGIRLHYVIGGKGEPLVLLHGWPHTWYQWNQVLPALAKLYTVIVPDLRGFGDSAKPLSGYDSKTFAEDIYQLVKQLGFQRIFLAGADWGFAVAYAYACAHREDVIKLVNVDSPLPGINWEQLAEYTKEAAVEGGIWHFMFNAVPDLPEALLSGNERTFISYFFEHYSYNIAGITEAEIDEYVRCYSAPGGIRGSVGLYREVFESSDQNREYAKTKLKMPVLALGGSFGLGSRALEACEAVADNVTGIIVEKCGHFIPEERPDYLVKQLFQFFEGESPASA
jgi:pimeloyl-ACP methyl ester carboxylesterase